MRLFYVKPQIHKFDMFDQFAEEFKVGKGDLLLTCEFIYEPFMKFLNLQCDFLFQEKYGLGEPSNIMIDAIVNEIRDKEYKRVIAVGGGTVIDIGKLLILKGNNKTLDLFEKKVPIIKNKELIIIPTTCGTGSEVTNISIIEIKEKHTKMGLACEELYADYTILIPELVKGLPYKFFQFSSVDALIHALESFVSPKSNCYTEIFSIKAMDIILEGYKQIIKYGEDYRLNIVEEFLIASNYAGIAFGNAGVGAVHALSYPLGGAYHVPHGEANYQVFIEIFKTYTKKNPEGKIKKLNEIIAKILGIERVEEVYEELDKMLSVLIGKKKLSEYGMKKEEINEFADSVIEKQQRLLVNNYVSLSKDEIIEIYKKLY